MTEKSQLFGRIFITCNIKAMTGLHIGGSSTGLEIGGVDNPVIVDALTDTPYIPGSSLRGKMRSQLEKTLGLRQNNRVGKATIHTCKTPAEYDANNGCPVCHIFGVPGETDATGSTLLLVRDVMMTETTRQELIHAHTDLTYTELKTEVAIDRVTSAAAPRNIERVPAGAIFGPAELVFAVYTDSDFNRFRHVVDGLQLLEDDYLGGSGSRGSGKIKFENLKISARSSRQYSQLEVFKDFASLQDLETGFSDLLAWARRVIPLAAAE